MRRGRFVCSIFLAMISIGVSSTSDMDKRAPSGFQGMRGKKSLQGEFQDNALFTPGDPRDKRVPSAGFVGMRGKKLFSERLDTPTDLFKRAPMGFMGMRGKKDMEIMDFADQYDEKRAPMGFMGMRGKKETENFVLQDPSFYMVKKAPMGFLGVRGKKDYELPEDEKRSPSSGFFGMRGKKQPTRSSFFGMRGKKYPYELRGKFVGVRGKKMSDDGYFHENDLDTFEDIPNNIDDLMMYLTENENDLSVEKRKTPNGFFGMRG